MKKRLVIAIEGTPLAMRIVPHKTNPAKLVLKAAHPEVGAMFCHLANIEAGNTWQGSNFFITEVDRMQLAKAVGATVAALVDGDVSSKMLAASSKCSECGCEGGVHWQFCSNSSPAVDASLIPPYGKLFQ